MFPPPTLLVLLRARSFDERVITEARSSYVAWASRGFWPKRLKAQGAAVEVGKKEKGVMFEDIVSLKCLWVGKRMAAPYPPPRVLKVPSLSLKGGLVRQILCSISGIVQRSSRACALSVVPYLNSTSTPWLPLRTSYLCSGLLVHASWLVLQPTTSRGLGEMAVVGRELSCCAPYLDLLAASLVLQVVFCIQDQVCCIRKYLNCLPHSMLYENLQGATKS